MSQSSGPDITPCLCRICRDFDYARWCWQYVPVRYGVRRQRLAGLLRWLDRQGRQPSRLNEEEHDQSDVV